MTAHAMPAHCGELADDTTTTESLAQATTRKCLMRALGMRTDGRTERGEVLVVPVSLEAKHSGDDELERLELPTLVILDRQVGLPQSLLGKGSVELWDQVRVEVAFEAAEEVPDRTLLERATKKSRVNA